MNIPAKKWTRGIPPRRILAIRLQAMGDMVITLPYLQQLRNHLPAGTGLDLLTREEVAGIPRNMDLFDRVFSIGGGRDLKKQLLSTGWLLPRLMMRRYEAVLDLQNNIVSRIVRCSLLPRAWSEFDRFSPVAAGERTRLTIEAAGLGKWLGDVQAGADRRGPVFNMNNREEALRLLKDNGWDGKSPLVLLNPAGAFPSRNWPLSNYTAFAKRWKLDHPETCFLMVGTGLIREKAEQLRQEIGPGLINLAGRTDPSLAFSVMQQLSFALSEDSGLMHMAWVSGIPTLALFGSTCSDRARPVGVHTAFLDSSDLECGQCMQEHCRFGNTPCLLRYSAELVYERAKAIMPY